MKVALAIVGGAVIIAAAILILGRWQISGQSPYLRYRLDRWTGNVELCQARSGAGDQLTMSCWPVSEATPQAASAPAKASAPTGEEFFGTPTPANTAP
jgi:hypothetical protein